MRTSSSLITLGLWIALSCALPRGTHAAAPDDALLVQARYERGIKLYQLGKLEAAVAEFKMAYQLAGSPSLLFNLGQCYRLLGDRTSALASYRAYLHQLPEAPNRDDVEEKIADLERTVVPRPGRAAPPVAPPPLTRDPGPVPARTSRIALLSTLAAMGFVGTVSLATAGGLSLRANAAADALGAKEPGSPWTRADAEQYQDGRRAESASIGLYVVGGVVLAAGAITAIVTRGRLARERPARISARARGAMGGAWNF